MELYAILWRKINNIGLSGVFTVTLKNSDEAVFFSRYLINKLSCAKSPDHERKYDAYMLEHTVPE